MKSRAAFLKARADLGARSGGDHIRLLYGKEGSLTGSLQTWCPSTPPGQTCPKSVAFFSHLCFKAFVNIRDLYSEVSASNYRSTSITRLPPVERQEAELEAERRVKFKGTARIRLESLDFP